MLVEDAHGSQVSQECLFFCAPGCPAPCDDEGCGCVCHEHMEGQL